MPPERTPRKERESKCSVRREHGNDASHSGLTGSPLESHLHVIPLGIRAAGLQGPPGVTLSQIREHRGCCEHEHRPALASVLQPVKDRPVSFLHLQPPRRPRPPLCPCRTGPGDRGPLPSPRGTPTHPFYPSGLCFLSKDPVSLTTCPVPTSHIYVNPQALLHGKNLTVTHYRTSGDSQQ